MNRPACIRIIFALLIAHISVVGYGQDGVEDLETTLGLEKADAQREEIQRYFGYEQLLFRYLTLPYDLHAQINQRGLFLDIGYVLFSLGPIILLVLVYHRKYLFYSLLVILILYLGLCVHHGHLLTSNLQKYNPATDSLTGNIVQAGPEAFILVPAYRILAWISTPLVSILDYFTGDQDHNTYLILAGILCLIIFGIIRSSWGQRSKSIALIISVFGLFWWILGSGIIWYGMLILPVVYVWIIKGGISYFRTKATNVSKYVIATVTTICISYAILGYLLRVANNNYIPTDHEDYGRRIVDFRIIPYTVGEIGAQEALNYLGANVGEIISKLNTNNDIIIQISSPFSFNIKNSNNRIFEDNTLSHFYLLARQHRTRGAISRYYYDHGVRYFLLDTKLASLDTTPEQTLKKKFLIFTKNFLEKNPRVKLLGTDQIIEQADGTRQYAYFAKTGDRIVHYGSYAAFQLLP